MNKLKSNTKSIILFRRSITMDYRRVFNCGSYSYSSMIKLKSNTKSIILILSSRSITMNYHRKNYSSHYEYMEAVLRHIRSIGYHTGVIMFDWRDICFDLGGTNRIVVSSPRRKDEEFYVDVTGVDSRQYKESLGLVNYGSDHPHHIDAVMCALENLINNID